MKELSRKDRVDRFSENLLERMRLLHELATPEARFAADVFDRHGWFHRHRAWRTEMVLSLRPGRSAKIRSLFGGPNKLHGFTRWLRTEEPLQPGAMEFEIDKDRGIYVVKQRVASAKPLLEHDGFGYEPLLHELQAARSAGLSALHTFELSLLSIVRRAIEMERGGAINSAMRRRADAIEARGFSFSAQLEERTRGTPSEPWLFV